MAGGLPHPVLLVEEGFKLVGLPVPAHVAYAWFVMALLIFLGVMATRKLSMVPRGGQNFFEFVIGGLEDFVVANMGESGRKVFPFLCALFLFIISANVIGLFPGMDSPTNNVNTNAAMALTVFVYYNIWGVINWGPGYIKHFMGPFWWLAWLMFPIEIISHLARPLSLTLRLFGNIRGEEIVLILLFSLAPILGTFPMYFLFGLADCIQAFVFFMLSMIYLKGAFEHAH
ncbi:F0F1 ATP synthase subunit A [Desulfovibrio inopinatus]|uniref:F0F1 ATP synthase subunit A n=1 Tax=Desulfovibrio inopinatus TaxID=102109 RepID=UPI000428C75F|nr:F0F1 ATP synthase subunit A [Desulfovibrio inopinatus]